MLTIPRPTVRTALGPRMEAIRGCPSQTPSTSDRHVPLRIAVIAFPSELVALVQDRRSQPTNRRALSPRAA